MNCQAKLCTRSCSHPQPYRNSCLSVFKTKYLLLKQLILTLIHRLWRCLQKTKREGESARSLERAGGFVRSKLGESPSKLWTGYHYTGYHGGKAQQEEYSLSNQPGVGTNESRCYQLQVGKTDQSCGLQQWVQRPANWDWQGVNISVGVHIYATRHWIWRWMRWSK